MKRLLGFAALLVPLVIYCAAAPAQEPKEKAGDKDAGGEKTYPGSESKLPVPDHRIPMDLSSWRKVFSISKMTYNKDDNHIVFLVKARRNMTFKDDGYDAPFSFLDQDGVNLTPQKNLSWEHEVKSLHMGDATRVTLDLPDDETLQKAKKCRAVVKGFFNK